MRQDSGQGMNFLEAIFSFVFGDGNPNESYEDRRWRLVSNSLHIMISALQVSLSRAVIALLAHTIYTNGIYPQAFFFLDWWYVAVSHAVVYIVLGLPELAQRSVWYLLRAKRA